MTAAAAPAPRRSTAGALLALVRWPNALIAGAGVVLGAWWAEPARVTSQDVALGVVVAFLLTAVVNAANDARDVAIDRVAHPDRPLVRGELHVRTAWRLAVAAYVAAALVASVLPWPAPAIALGAGLAGFAYAVLLARVALLGNVVVAVVASLPFVLGGAVVGDVKASLPLLAVAVPLHLAREVMKDLADAHGDRGVRRTIALGGGPRAARLVSLAAVAAYAALVTLQFAPAGPRRVALLPSAALAAWSVLRARPSRASSCLKLAMLFAMAALPLLR